MLNTLNTFLNLEDKDVFDKFKTLTGYEVIEGFNFILLKPTTETVTPVLLSVNTDTKRKSINIKKTQKYPSSDEGFIYHNDNDSLGYESRAGCSMCYYMGKNFTSKPFILLTKDKHGNQDGMLDFLDSNVFRHIRNLIYHVVSFDTAGVRQAEFYGKDITKQMAELLMYEHDFGVSQSDKSPYEFLLEEYDSVGVPHVSLSNGGYGDGILEIIEEGSYLKNFHSVIEIILSIRKEHSVKYVEDTKTEQVIDFDYTCEVCKDKRKIAKFRDEYKATLCLACYNRLRINNKHKKDTGKHLVQQEANSLLRDRVKSWIDNNIMVYDSVQPSGTFCPVCVGTKLKYHKKKKCLVCLDCQRSYYNEILQDGHSFSFTGDILEHNDSVIIQQQELVHTIQNGKVINTDILSTVNEYFRVCSTCGLVHPKQATAKCRALDSNGKEYQFDVCKKCLKYK